MTVSAEITARSHDPSSSKWKRRAALERWAEFVGACADGREADVIAIRPRLSLVA
ncbi:integrase [Burkholderia multivorans]|uniref:integrase n=1 Tax=Burkholderia multivorans TaxID=87883 RepID=UPI0021C0281E|nr:integrase [Burkholderia multivorans]